MRNGLFLSAGVLVMAAQAAASTVSLQEGNGGYAGCTDTFLYDYGALTNYDSYDTLFLCFERYSS